MKFVDDCIRLVVRRVTVLPTEACVTGRQHAKWSSAGVGSFSHGQLAIEIAGEKYAGRVRVEQNFLGIKTMDIRGRLTRNRVCVITSIADLAKRYAAMPNSS